MAYEIVHAISNDEVLSLSDDQVIVDVPETTTSTSSTSTSTSTSTLYPILPGKPRGRIIVKGRYGTIVVRKMYGKTTT